MSIAVLTQVYDETRRLAIAGSHLASGDFRLKKLVPPLEASAAKAPVFGKVAEAIRTLVDGPAADSADRLLELSTLVSAILYTQGETGAEGPLEEVETTDFGLPASNASARVLKPLIEALTNTGSGREEIVRDAHERGAFHDLRLIRVAVGALDDPYPPIADYIADKVLPMYGKAIYEDLKSTYDPKAKGGQVRRLRLMHRLDPERTRELVDLALESGSADMKVAAIECLEGSQEALSYLLEQSKAKNSQVRRAALNAMAKFTSDDVVASLIKSLSGGDLELAAEPASRNRSPKLLKFLLDEAGKQLDELFAIKDKTKAGKAMQRFYQLLQCFVSRDDKETIAFLARCFERRDDLGRLKGDVDGQQINRRVASLLVRSDLKPVLALVADSHASLPPEVLDCAILAAVRTRKPKEVYDLFSPYYLVKTDAKKKRGDPASQKRESVRELLAALSGERGHRHSLYGTGHDVGFDAIDLDKFAKVAELDARWLEAAIATDDREMVEALARPKHKGACEFLSRAIDGMLAKKGDLDYDVTNALEAMIRIEHPRAVEHYLAALQRAAGNKRQYYAYWLARLIPSLPKGAAPRIEALLPSLHEKVVDQIAPYLSELQAKV